MLSLLKQFNYTSPQIQEENWKNIKIQSNGNGYYYLLKMFLLILLGVGQLIIG